MNLIIGVTGSVASIKLDLLIKNFQSAKLDINIRIVYTENSLHFTKDCNQEILKSFSNYTDQTEWNSWKQIGDPVLHIELRNWADAILIAPLDANTMSKIANGGCDNLLTCIIRAWDVELKGDKVFLAPAMNTAMWQHPITAQHIIILKTFGYNLIMPIHKKLACGDIGVGAMAGVDEIVDQLLAKME